jgi:hypothetical protein
MHEGDARASGDIFSGFVCARLRTPLSEQSLSDTMMIGAKLGKQLAAKRT